VSRVLLTGATGFVGRETLAALERDGHEVHVAARRRPDQARAGSRWHEADLLADLGSAGRIVAASQPEVLVHLAWYAEHGRFWTAPENVDWVEASLRLLHEFGRAESARRVVMAGTCAEYEWTTRSVFAENDPCVPRTLYGVAKHGLRVAAEDCAAERGLSFAWARLFFLYGPGEAPERFVPSIARRLLAGEPAPMTEGTQVRDFLHVADAAAAFAALAAGEIQGPVNVASGVGVTLRDLAALIAGRAGGAEHLQVGTIATRPDDPPSLVADVTRLRDEVGWLPRIGLDDGVAQSVDWWRNA
jgi:nucleoside-diphosphate-sugar epimerase